MSAFSLDELYQFIVRAKAATYAGNGRPSMAHRPESHDLEFYDGDFAYLDSYFGGVDFIGQEVVYHQAKPVWAMNYYGRILEPTQITPAETIHMIKASLTHMYQTGHFLGGFEHTQGQDSYVDTNKGNVSSFVGQEWINRQGVKVYELVYHGGLIK